MTLALCIPDMALPHDEQTVEEWLSDCYGEDVRVVVPEPDAGVGLTRVGMWLVSTPRGTWARWLAPWCQSIIAEAHNAPLLALRALTRTHLGRRVALTLELRAERRRTGGTRCVGGSWQWRRATA